MFSVTEKKMVTTIFITDYMFITVTVVTVAILFLPNKPGCFDYSSTLTVSTVLNLLIVANIVTVITLQDTFLLQLL